MDQSKKIMSDLDSNLLKFDMQLTAKKLKLRNKTTNILLRDATSSNTFSKSTPTKSDFSCPKKASKENRNKMFEFHGRYSKKKNIRRPVNYTWNRYVYYKYKTSEFNWLFNCFLINMVTAKTYSCLYNMHLTHAKTNYIKPYYMAKLYL